MNFEDDKSLHRGPWHGTRAKLKAEVGPFKLLVRKTGKGYNWSVRWTETGALLDGNTHSSVLLAQDLCLIAIADFYAAEYRTFSSELSAQVSLEQAWDLIATGLVDPVDMGEAHVYLAISEDRPVEM